MLGNILVLTGSSKCADFVLKSDMESGEEEEIIEEDDELVESQNETAVCLRNMEVKLKPQLLEHMEPANQGKSLKETEQKPANEELLLEVKMEPVHKDPEPRFNLLQVLQENGNLR